MSRAIDRWRRAIRNSDLTPTCRHVALELAEFMDYDTLCNAYPGAARLAKLTGYHPRTVERTLRRLETEGWVQCVHRGGSRREEQRAHARGDSRYLGRRERSASNYCGRFPRARPPAED